MLKKLLLFCLVLCLPSLAFGQAFQAVVDSSQYPAPSVGNTIPLRSDLAILAVRIEPRGNYSNIVDVNIIPSITYSSDTHVASNGWTVYDGVYGESGYQINYSVISASTLFTRIDPYSGAFLQQIQNVLISKNLGTVAQRAAFIRGFHSRPVQIIDIDNFKKSILNALSPFLNIYLGIFLTLFVVDLMSKKSKDVIAESAKIQRRAERAQQRREMRADPTAQIFEFRLANFSSIASGSVSDPSISRRKARRLFEDTAMEYAEYKKSRGWKY